MSSIGSSGPRVGSPLSGAQAAQAQIERVASDASALAQQLDALLRELDQLMAREPRHPGPTATREQLRAYQTNHDRWQNEVDVLQGKIDAIVSGLEQLEKELATLQSQVLPAAQDRDRERLKAYVDSLYKQISDLGKELAAAKQAASRRGITSAMRAAIYTRVRPAVGRVGLTARGLPLG